MARGQSNNQPVQETELGVRADPDKLFFIEMLVKDIELIPAILDLADNSVDSARQIALSREKDEVRKKRVQRQTDSSINLPDGSFNGLEVSLSISPEEFSISDNCAGITLEVARNHAFRFGRPRAFAGTPGSVGEFGVGMKRALFKLGRWFSVDSRSASERFELEVNVDVWMNKKNENDWTFKLNNAQSNLPVATDEDRGTTIIVRRLHESVQSDFEDETVAILLREQLRLRHQAAIDLGLKIKLNGETLTGLSPALMSGKLFKPIRRSFVIEDTAGSVMVELIAGIVRSDRRDSAENDGRAENFRRATEAGWWVFCNNRLLLVADKSTDTGWGNGAAVYHPQYRLFRGYVYMSALETSLLPWNTTKTGIDSDSRVWRKVQSHMVSALVDVQAVLNRLKTEREQQPGPDDEGFLEFDYDESPYIDALAEAEPVLIKNLERRESMELPTIPKNNKAKKRKTILQRLQYDVPRDQYEKAMQTHRFGTAAQLGRRCFDYFYKNEVADK